MACPIPEDFFNGVSGTRASMFNHSLSFLYKVPGGIPENLFSGINGAPQANLFNRTFVGSKFSGSIPAGLFSGITGTAQSNMFLSTFENCSNLTGFVPPELFSGISGTATNMMTNVFSGSGLLTACPCGYKQYITGFESYFSSKVSCEIGAKAGDHWNNGICSKECTGGFTRLKTATGLDFPVLSDKTSDLSIALKNTANNTVCYVPTASGSGNLNFLVNGTTYHATEPDEIIPPDFTGQPD